MTDTPREQASTSDEAASPPADAGRKTRRTRLSVKASAVLVVGVISGLLLEGGARLVFHYGAHVSSAPIISGLLRHSLSLDAYEMPSERGGYHWVLRPGYEASPEQLIADKARRHRTRGARALKSALPSAAGSFGTVLRIGRDGFKGPDPDPDPARVRVLALGDSVTFGVGPVDYPRAMETALEKQGLSVQVINGGVEGYSPRNILLEMERYRKLKPKIVTLLIGWNSLYSQSPWPDALENRVRLVWLGRRVVWTVRGILGYWQTDAEALYKRQPKPDRKAPEVQALNDYTPPFLDRIERIVDGFQAAGARVVLVTLPGLLTVAGTPSSEALEKGHLPYFTVNPFVLAKLTERYNAALRALATRLGLEIIDLEIWSVDSLRPREAYFSDSVHLTPVGLERVGAFMAERLSRRIEELQRP